MITPDDPLYIRLRQARNVRRLRIGTLIVLGVLLAANLNDLWRNWQ